MDIDSPLSAFDSIGLTSPTQFFNPVSPMFLRLPLNQIFMTSIGNQIDSFA